VLRWPKKPLAKRNFERGDRLDRSGESLPSISAQWMTTLRDGAGAHAVSYVVSTFAASNTWIASSQAARDSANDIE